MTRGVAPTTRLTFAWPTPLVQRLRDDAAHRHQTVDAYTRMVLADWVHELDARTGTMHGHCFCRDRSAQNGRCCWCSEWLAS